MESLISSPLVARSGYYLSWAVIKMVNVVDAFVDWAMPCKYRPLPFFMNEVAQFQGRKANNQY
jgi:hypothetical protein